MCQIWFVSQIAAIEVLWSSSSSLMS